MEGGVTPFSSSMAPSGSYILIVVGQPLTEDHKQIILQRLNKGLLSWDVNSTGCDLSGLEYALSANIKDSVTESDVLIQHSTESLGVEVLLSPTVRTLKQCVKNLLSTATSHKQLIHAGYTFAGSGSWILENGTFSFQEFLDIFKQADVQSQKRCTINVHCTEEGEWNKTNFDRDIFTKVADISLNPPEKVNHVPGSEHLIKCLESALVTQSLEEMMKPSPLVGNIRFNRPTIYMFPAGQGDCALFGINGFNMLIDGGFHRKPCSWDFIRHLDRLDAVLVTRIAESNVNGMSTLMKRNALNNANPQIGYVFCNIAENKSNSLKNGTSETKDDLVVSVVGEGHNFVQTLSDLKLKPHQCWRDSSVDPFVLYHKVGQGTLEMHVLSPPRDSKEMKLFLSEWNAYKETFSGVKSELRKSDNMIPLSHATSICAILVWRPEDPKDTITRILFPGSAPQGKILEGLEKLKVLNILNQPVVTKASLNIPASKVISNKIEKSISRASIPNRNNTASPALSVSSHASRNGDIGGLKKEVKKVTKEIKRENKEVKKEVKKEIKKDVKEVKKDIKNEIVPKKDVIAKKESVKDAKKETKDIKKIVKKEVKPVVEKKAAAEKKEVKSAPKKESTTPTVKATAEVKKASTTVRKSTTPVKKDLGKPPIAPKASDTKKSVSKTTESKTTKDVNNKKSTESKTVSKTKPKAATASPKMPSTPKTKPVSVPKQPGSKVSKAVAASSIVASVVAVTAAAFELNEKKEVLEDTEPEVSEKEVDIVVDSKEPVLNEKLPEDVASPLPPEALSPTPSESVSLTPSDTLSSAPLETVSPTPPLPNEPISAEEKDVNEIKELEQDVPDEQREPAEETEMQNAGIDDLKTENDVNEIEVELAKHQASSDVMSTSFVAEKQEEYETVEEQFEKVQFKEHESVPLRGVCDRDDLSEKDDLSVEKDDSEEKPEFHEEEKDMVEERETFDEKDIADEKEVVEEKDTFEEKYSYEEKANIEEEETAEKPCSFEDKYDTQKNETEEETSSAEEKDIVEEKDVAEEKYFVEEKNTTEEKYVAEEKELDDVEVIEEKDNVEVIEEKDNVEVIEEKDDVEVIEEKDDVKEKDIMGIESNTSVESHMVEVNDSINIMEENDYKKSYEAEAKDIDEQLAGLSMEGSFCAGMMMSTDREGIPTTEAEYMQITENNEDSYSHHVDYNDSVTEEHYETKFVSETESHLKSEVSESELLKSQNLEEYKEQSFDECVDIGSAKPHSYETQFLNQDDAYSNIQEESTKQLEETENDEITTKMPANYEDHDSFIGSEDIQKTEELSQEVIENKETHFDHFSQMHSMEASFHQDAYDNFEPTNIDDLEMQETSVDEPEEIIRKESAVSITLNDDNPVDHYSDNWRRKSGTESEDDVDIGKYMCKEPAVDEEKLHIQRGSDSDDEDVVKSPTPHAVVDYEGQLDEIASNDEMEANDKKREIATDKEIYINEKEDFDEKDRDSAEEQDTDDGEMIRHPTPPEMKYSEEEMRDPIGQHFITNPSLKPQSTDITEQPLYEEAEDSESERSASPIIEQPVFGNVVQADFPELVTVSGGTTPSEPQSPKATLDAKKFPTEAAVMEALSEHDASESSTHSPSCQDGSTAFDLQGSERSVIEIQSLQDDDALSITKETKFDSPLHGSTSEMPENVSEMEKSSHVETTVYEDKEDNKEDKQETPSDEEESSSEDENSESHSKDKSDAMGDRSDVERDDRSDIHNDDKSDHHHDGKSDVVNDDDDKSDIQEDEHVYRQQNIFAEHEIEDGFQKNPNFGLSHESEMHYEHENQYEKQYGYESSHTYEQHSEFGLETDLKSNVTLPNQYDIENIQTERSSEENTEIYALNTDEKYVTNTDYDNEMHTGADSKGILEYESTCSDKIQSENSETAICEDSTTLEYHSTNLENLKNDEAEKDSKMEDNESINTFQTYETDFEHSKSNNYIHGLDTYDHQNEIEVIPVDTESVSLNISDCSQAVPSGFENSSNFEKYGSENFQDNVHLHENISHQPEGNFVVESAVESEETKTYQNENTPQYGESEETCRDAYSEITLTKTVVSGENLVQECHISTEETIVSETNLGFEASSHIKSFSGNSPYDYSSEIMSDKMNDIAGNQLNVAYQTSDIVNESYGKAPNLDFGTDTPVESYSVTDSYRQEESNYSYREEYRHEDYGTEKEIAIESTSELLRETSEMVSNSGYTTEITDINFNGKDAEIVSSSEFTMINGKDQASFSLPPSEFHSDNLQAKETVVTTTQQLEHDSTYLANSRFHSDSPEDNTMRSDSSPDAPYPIDITDIKNSVPIETCSETFMHNTEDYKNNINFSSTEGIPHSPNSHSLNANQNNTFVESDDESNTHVRGNVSPYAYTNKAYTREEEDIDGNHIYKEESTEVLKQVEFDGNMPPLSTNQVSSVMNYPQEYQNVQYSTGANYDFNLEEWGKPMGLPTPPDSTQKTVKKSDKVTVKSKTTVDANGKMHSPSVSSKLSSPLKKPKPKTKESSSSPIYVDLAYVPQHADPHYCDIEFFKKIRARYYVISSVNPSKEVLNALLEAKKTWNEDLSVTIIPTYETDTLGYWMAQNQNDLAEYSIDVSPSASRCTVNLQDHQTSCSAYRLEF